MKIMVCNSKEWFKLSDQLLSNHQILSIKKKDELNLETLDRFKPDLVFFPHWNWIVSNEIFEKYTCILFHTAPLPFGRGGSPIQNLIKCGYKKSPVCALAMSEGIDTGPIYDQIDISLQGPLSEILDRLNNVVNLLMLRLLIIFLSQKYKLVTYIFLRAWVIKIMKLTMKRTSKNFTIYKNAWRSIIPKCVFKSSECLYRVLWH